MRGAWPATHGGAIICNGQWLTLIECARLVDGDSAAAPAAERRAAMMTVLRRIEDGELTAARPSTPCAALQKIGDMP
jgi:hypothetical protein